MKRSLVAILAIIYFTISSGVVMNIHYCMGKSLGAQLDILGAKTCGCGKSEKKSDKKSCCKTEFKIVKIEDEQKASYAVYNMVAPFAIIANELNLLQPPLYNAPETIRPNGHSPPILPVQDIYLQNCVFLI